MTHLDLWGAVDKFAAERGMTCSGMARKCGLDATIFNKSKRFSKYGQPRWLSMETIARMLNVSNANIQDFIKYFPEVSENQITTPDDPATEH